MKGQVVSATLLANMGVSPERAGTSVGQCPGQELGIRMAGVPGQALCGAVKSVEGLSVTRSGDSRIGSLLKHGGLTVVREGISEVLVGPPG
jgi:hypothetical protein